MTNRVIKICNFVHYFFREGGYIDSDQFSLLLFSLFMVGGGVQMEIVPNSLFPLFFFWQASLNIWSWQGHCFTLSFLLKFVVEVLN